MTLFIAVILILIVQRLIELRISSRNYKVLIREGGVEYGREHYKYIVMLHTLFIITMIFEYLMRELYGKLSDISYLFLVFFALLQIMRFWVIHSLGKLNPLNRSLKTKSSFMPVAPQSTIMHISEISVAIYSMI